MKKLILLMPLLLVACSKDDKPFIDERVANLCLQREIFNECMKLLPAGPASTKYNDWDEVVNQCGRQAYYMSIRKESTIPAECR
jgi:hypothetical protein